MTVGSRSKKAMLTFVKSDNNSYFTKLDLYSIVNLVIKTRF
mgnify:FL=1